MECRFINTKALGIDFGLLRGVRLRLVAFMGVLLVLAAQPCLGKTVKKWRAGKDNREVWSCVHDETSYDCDIEIEDFVVGQTYQINGVIGPNPNEYDQVQNTFSSSGVSDFAMTADGCSGTTLGPGQSCSWTVVFTPTDVGERIRTFSISATPTFVHTYRIIGTSFADHPECPKEEPGSLIGVDQRTLGEQVPIVGTGLFLAYTSLFAPEYVSQFNKLGIKSYFNPDVWTVSKHHYYHRSSRQLFLGSGSAARAAYTPDGAGNDLVMSQDGDEIFVFDSSTGMHLSTLSSLTGVTKLTFGYTSNRLTSIQDAFSNTTVFNRNGSGILTSIVAPFGQTTTIGVNGSGQITSVQNPASQTHSMTYASGTRLLATFTKPGAQVSTFSYDSNGRLTQDLGHGGNLWNLSQSGSTITMSSALSRSSTYQVSQSSGVYTRTETEPSGLVNTYSQNRSGTISSSNVIRGISRTATNDERFGLLFKRTSSEALTMASNTRTTNFGQTVSNTSSTPHWFNYTSITKTSTVDSNTASSVFTRSTGTYVNTSAAGATETIQLNSNEQPTSLQTGSDTAWTISYDSNGRVSSTIQGSKNGLTYAYNSAGFLQSVTNARSETTSYTYDSAGRKTKVTLPDSREISVAYDVNGNMTSVTPPSRPVHEFEFNAKELMSSYKPPSIGTGVAKDTTYAYNNDRQMTSITRPGGSAATYTYNSTTGNLTQITQPSGSTYQYSYYSSNQLEWALGPQGVGNRFSYRGSDLAFDEQYRTSDFFLLGKVSFGFDSNHRLTSRTVRPNSSSAAHTINYIYNADEKLTGAGDLSISYSYPSGRISTTTLGGVSDSRTYDAYGNLETYTATYTPGGGGTPSTLYTYTLTRDNASRIVGKTETIQGSTKVFVYSYDSAGRLTQVTENSVTAASFTYDQNSNATSGSLDGNSFTATYDNQDRILTFGSRTYTHNNFGEMTGVQTSTGNAAYTRSFFGYLTQSTTLNGKSLLFSNDSMGRRVAKFEGGGSVFIWRAIYEDNLRMAAYVDNNTGTVPKEFVYGTGRNVADYMISSGVNYRIITDHLGSPRLVVNASTGAVAQRMDYNVLGRVIRDTNSCFQPFGFAGGLYDPDTKLVRFGARDYDAETGRWTSKDPIGFAGGDTNLFGYVLQDPVNFIDPTGENPAAIIGIGIVGIGIINWFTHYNWGNANDIINRDSGPPFRNPPPGSPSFPLPKGNPFPPTAPRAPICGK